MPAGGPVGRDRRRRRVVDCGWVVSAPLSAVSRKEHASMARQEPAVPAVFGAPSYLSSVTGMIALGAVLVLVPRGVGPKAAR
jgi:hypothetical protein